VKSSDKKKRQPTKKTLAVGVVAFFCCAVVLAPTCNARDMWFENLQGKLKECRTEDDVVNRFGKPECRTERGGGVAVDEWSWGGLMAQLGRFEGCAGFSAGISTETGNLLWWSPHWLGSVPAEAKSVYFPEECTAVCPAKDGCFQTLVPSAGGTEPSNPGNEVESLPNGAAPATSTSSPPSPLPDSPTPPEIPSIAPDSATPSTIRTKSP
jgi:hypothetical protein